VVTPILESRSVWLALKVSKNFMFGSSGRGQALLNVVSKASVRLNSVLGKFLNLSLNS